MLPFVLFFGLCFFGWGDCQDNNDLANVRMLTVEDFEYHDGYFTTTTKDVREASLKQLASVMICPEEHLQYTLSGGWQCGMMCNNYSHFSLETFADGSKAYICTSHIDHEKFYYDYGVIRLYPEINNSTQQSIDNVMGKEE